MNIFTRAALVFLALLAFSSQSSTASAEAAGARGTPTSADFGYGVNLDLNGLFASQAVQAAAALPVDWIAVRVNWGDIWPDPSTSPDFRHLDPVVGQAGLANLPVLVNLVNPPDWAAGSSGPDAALTVEIISQLAHRYPQVIQAVELFPGANTQAGWKALPDPESYGHLLQAVRSHLEETKCPMWIVAGGLTPLGPTTPAGDMDDLSFLDLLYRTGGMEGIQVVSIRLPDVAEDTLQAPDGQEHRILRHYEEVRQVMVKHSHTEGILWITHFSLPSGRILNQENTVSPSSEIQGLEPGGNQSGGYQSGGFESGEWIAKAYRQLRSQLYIGAVFFDRINPPVQDGGITSLIRPDQTYHAVFEVFRRLIAQNTHTQIEPIFFIDPSRKHIQKDRP